MQFATELLRFFTLPKSTPASSFNPKTLKEFVDANPDARVSLYEMLRVIQHFKNQGILISLGADPTILTGSPFSNERLVCISFDEKKAKYGAYDFSANGFSYVAEHFSKSVRPIEIMYNNEELDIGTGFLFGSDRVMVTARHVIEKARNVKIKNSQGDVVRARQVFASTDGQIDLAFIEFEPGKFNDARPFRMSYPKILEEVLTIGYPPIPGFDAIQFYERATLNNRFKVSRGQLIASAYSHVEKQDFFILNAKVKGGNSGGPVINAEGYVVGVVSALLHDIDDLSKVDSLGYGVVLPTQQFQDFTSNDQFAAYHVTNTNEGFSIDWKRIKVDGVSAQK